MEPNQDYNNGSQPATDFNTYQSSEMARDTTIRDVGFDKPAPDPDAVPVMVNRVTTPQPVKPVEPSMPEPPQPPYPPVVNNTHFENPPQQPELPQPKPRGKRRWWLWLLILLLVAVVAGYLAADDGLVRGGSHLPYHIFSKYKNSSTSSSTSSSSSSSTATTTASVPSGFSQYQLQDAHIQFAAPTSWGTPSFSSDPGYALRGGSNKSTGVHAYLVTFATNKTVQLALTNGTLMPASATDSRYYDYLDWCSGTLDQQYYLKRLIFYTDTNKIDHPGTVSCDQGPLTNAIKVSASTIEMPNVKDTKGQLLGNIYIDNLTGNPQAVVLRVLDGDMKNDTDIKSLLTTVQNI